VPIAARSTARSPGRRRAAHRCAAVSGERAIIDGAGSLNDTFVVQGPYSIFWGFEVVNTDPTRCCSTSSNFRADMVTNYAPHTKFVNLVVARRGPGFFVSTTYPDVEISGSIVYNIGYQGSDRGHGHAMYIKSDVAPCWCATTSCSISSGSACMNTPTPASGQLRNIHVEGNVVFNKRFALEQFPVGQHPGGRWSGARRRHQRLPTT